MKYLEFWKAFVFLSGLLILSGALMYSEDIICHPAPIPCFIIGGIMGMIGLIGLFRCAKK